MKKKSCRDLLHLRQSLWYFCPAPITSSAGKTALLQSAHVGADTVDRHCVGL
jgi:hypothetical protein